MSKTGWIVLNSWAGSTKHRVEVLRETPKRYQVRWMERAFRRPAGYVQFVPKYVVRWTEPDVGK